MSTHSLPRLSLVPVDSELIVGLGSLAQVGCQPLIHWGAFARAPQLLSQGGGGGGCAGKCQKRINKTAYAL